MTEGVRQTEPFRLREVTARPYNAETPLAALGEEVTPVDLTYVRNHFDVPQLSETSWMLRVGGAVQSSLALSLRDVRRLPAQTLLVTLECAGNARTSMNPVPKGTPWSCGAVSLVQVVGTPLSGVLNMAGISESAVEVVFLGADRGEVSPARVERFGRSLPRDVAMEPDTLLVWEMNGQPLDLNHGFPLRLIVPGWYGVASVKWLTDISVVTEPYRGFFQSEHYVYLDEDGTAQGEPVRHKRVRALIVQPAAGAALPRGEVEVAGVAWSGHGAVVEVQVSVDGGHRWAGAELGPPASLYAMRRWRYRWNAEAPGRHTLACRATDTHGDPQPTAQRWNRLGYGNNGPHTIGVQVV